ncbi:MAG: hypothetical protein M3347_18825 [Armatimonadota bacterium]|nr:hypothetical protein [Armatimonadota bacterium]
MARYAVEVNGFGVAASAASYDARSHSVTLSLPTGTLREGDSVTMSWHDLRDTQGRTLSGQAGPVTTR